MNNLKIYLLFFLLSSTLVAQQIISLTWHEVVGISQRENLELKIKQEDLYYQVKNECKAIGEFLPTIKYQFQAINNIERPEFVVPNFGRIKFGTNYNFTHSVELQYPIFTGGLRWSNWKIQKNLSKSLQEQLRDKEDDIVLQALEAYFGLMLAKNLIDVNRRAFDAANANLEQVEKFFNLGGASKLDYLRAKSRYSSSLPPLKTAINSYDLAEEKLKFILNITPEDSLVVLDSLKEMEFLSSLEGMNLSDINKQALANRPDLKNMALQRTIASDQKTISLSKFMPQIIFAANLQHQAQVQDAAFVPNDFVRSKSAVLALQIPLFEGVKRIVDYQQASINERKAEIMFKLSERAVLLEVQASYLETKNTRENLATLRSAMLESRETLRLAELNYKEGIITQVDVLTAQLALTSSEVNFQQGIFDYNVSQLYLLRSIGRLDTIWKVQ